MKDLYFKLTISLLLLIGIVVLILVLTNLNSEGAICLKDPYEYYLNHSYAIQHIPR